MVIGSDLAKRWDETGGLELAHQQPYANFLPHTSHRLGLAMNLQFTAQNEVKTVPFGSGVIPIRPV
jgi:hypothetical protein